MNNFLSVNNKPTITDNADLLKETMCNSHKISCIEGCGGSVRNSKS